MPSFPGSELDRLCADDSLLRATRYFGFSFIAITSFYFFIKSRKYSIAIMAYSEIDVEQHPNRSTSTSLAPERPISSERLPLLGPGLDSKNA